jgi:hypothetical protein
MITLVESDGAVVRRVHGGGGGGGDVVGRGGAFRCLGVIAELMLC